MKINFLLLVLAIVSLANLVNAQTGSISIQGRLDSSFIKFFDCKELILKIHDPGNELLNSEELIKVAVNKDRFFKTNFKTPSRYTYISFWLINNGNTLNRTPGIQLPVHFIQKGIEYLDEAYLFETGDSIRLSINKNGNLSFSGKGAEKLNCQYRINNLESKGLYSRVPELLRVKEYDRAFNFQQDVLDLLIKMRLKILESYKGKMDEALYNRIYLDAIINAKCLSLNSFFSRILEESRYKDKNSVEAFQAGLKEWIDRENLSPIDTNKALYSKNFSKYIFDKEWALYRLSTKNIPTGDSFEDIYKIIKRKYSGELRDQIFLNCFAKLRRYFPQEIIEYNKDAIDVASKTAYRNALISLRKTLIGSAAFPFELEDINGKVHKLNDYKGKVIVMDFWFTGCFWCTKLNEAMHPIIQKYKNNKNVVFISVCEDQNKEQWIKSIKTGKYTSPENINLYTNGLATEHPLIKFYNFWGAPQQLIINKNGFLVSTNPPRPGGGLNFVYDRNTGTPDDILLSVNGKNFMKLLDFYLNESLSK